MTNDAKPAGISPAEIHHDRAAHRFVARVDGVECVVDYVLEDTRITITHTRVPAQVGGRGIATALVKAAFDVARAEGWKVVPACSYAAAWAERHPDVADLLA